VPFNTIKLRTDTNPKELVNLLPYSGAEPADSLKVLSLMAIKVPIYKRRG
jgi:hypothetical protein